MNIEFMNAAHTKITTKTCLNCLKTIEGTLTCSRCRTAKYCNKKCQSEHWPVHKLQCKDSNVEVRRDADPTKVNKEADLKKKMYKLQNFLDQGNFEKAEKRSKELQEEFTKLFGSDSVAVQAVINLLAKSYNLRNKYALAESLIKESLPRYLLLRGESKLTINAVHNLLRALMGQGKFDEAETLIKKYMSVQFQTLLCEEDRVLFMSTLGDLYCAQEKLTQAEIMYRKALELSGQDDFQSMLQRIVIMRNMGNVLINLGKLDDAVELLEDCVERGMAVAPSHPIVQGLVQDLARTRNLRTEFLSFDR